MSRAPHPQDPAPGAPAWDVAWDTSTRTGSVAVAGVDDAEFIERSVEGARAHASDLLPTVSELCADRGFALGRPAHVFVGLGPGSYTGLRVGIATALGLGRGAECAVRGVSTYAAIAFDALAPGERGVLLGDARRGTAYYGYFERTHGAVEELEPLRLVDCSELSTCLPVGARVLAETGLFAESEPSDASRATGPRPETMPLPRAGALLALGRALAASGAPEPALEPLYLRPWSSG